MNNLENKKYWIWFSIIEGLSCVKKLSLLKEFKNPEIIYNLKFEELTKINGVEEKIAKNIIKSKNMNLIDKHIEYMIKNNIDIITIYDEDYPLNLKQIYDFPISLYVKGNKKILNGKNIGIVGCRECSNYGKITAKYFGYNLSKENFNIVSGLAKGIDSYSHIGCLSANCERRNTGKTIAVVGTGLDIIYPKENFKLANKIIESGGTIISEYPCGTKISKYNFPARNRIISGISSGIIVVEAKEKSGTLITVDFALEQGKDIYVVPGNIDSINSVGTNELIKQGAKLITTYKDILI